MLEKSHEGSDGIGKALYNFEKVYDMALADDRSAVQAFNDIPAEWSYNK